MTCYKIEQALDEPLIYKPPYCDDCGGTGVITYLENEPVYCDCEATKFYYPNEVNS
jgi:hypothetical protein